MGRNPMAIAGQDTCSDCASGCVLSFSPMVKKFWGGARNDAGALHGGRGGLQQSKGLCVSTESDDRKSVFTHLQWSALSLLRAFRN